MTPAGPDRRTAIADAAITVLARDGARGLSHRAVDRELGIAEGSTSFYHRSRQALLDAATARLVDLDAAELDDPLAADPATAAAEVFARWSDAGHRERLLARFELLLGSVRAGGHPPLLAARQRFTDRAVAALTAAGVADPDAAALDLVARLEGHLLGSLLDGGARTPDRRNLLR